MQTYKTPTAWVIRLDKGDEIVQSLKDFCNKNSIRLAHFSGIGATNKVTLGLFETETKIYHTKQLTGDLEIAPLSGNITTQNSEAYVHAHITVSGTDFQAYAGHLQEATISATCEIILFPLDATVERQLSDTIGLNLMHFGEETE